MERKSVFSFGVMLVFIAFSTLEVLSQTSCSLLPTTEFFGAQNRALQGFVHNSTRVLSSVTCVRDCMIDPRCVSINYFDSKKRCQLNSATKSQSNSFIKLLGSFYYDEDRGTHLLSVFASCKELLHVAGGKISSGVYNIFPSSLSEGLEVYCDMEGNDGGWIVFQRRQDGSVDFDRNWVDYQRGFGDLKGEFWLGNDNLRALTEASPPGTWELKIDMEDWEGVTALAKYHQFRITGDLYTLNLSSYSSESTVPDSFMKHHSGHPFTTKDNDNDISPNGNCASGYKGAWWFFWCHDCNLNGLYYSTPSVLRNHGIQWAEWKGGYYSLKKCSMKIRESN